MKLVDYFKSRNQENAINKTLVHMQKVLECVVEYEKALSFLIEERNVDLALKAFFRVTELEHQADGIRRDILNMISKAELSSVIRENLSHLVKRIDDIANAANAGARIFIYLDLSEFLKLDDEIHKNIMEMSQLSINAVKKLNLMVNKLMDGEEEEIKRLGEEVNSLEHKIDEIHFKINRLLVSNKPDISPFNAIEIHNCITSLENISDNAEDVADYIIMLTISRR
jgi:predicted phosphate transport protein (TIGR00153 family)